VLPATAPRADSWLQAALRINASHGHLSPAA